MNENPIVLRDGTEMEPEKGEQFLAEHYNLIHDTGVFEFLDENREEKLDADFETENERGYINLNIRTEDSYISKYRGDMHNVVIMDIVEINYKHTTY